MTPGSHGSPRTLAKIVSITAVVTGFGFAGSPGRAEYAVLAGDMPGGTSAKEQVVAERGGQPLPHSQGRKFDSLDAYLRHLERGGAIDLPYYREIRPGIYVEVTTFRPPGPRPQAAREFTRKQLMQMYGFTK